jgi:hypothetical protein
MSENSDRDLILSEVLFVIQNKFSVVPNNNLHNVLTSFYSDDEILKAKKCLHDIAVKLCGAKIVGRFVSRSGENRRKMNTADLLDIFSLIDRQNASLPLFVAGSMMRIPGIRPLESDVVALSASLADLRQQVLFIKTSVSKSQTVGPAPASSVRDSDQPESVKPSASSIDLNFFPEQSGSPLMVELPPEPASKPAVAELCVTLSNAGIDNATTMDKGASSLQSPDEQDWTLVEPRNKKRSPPATQSKPTSNRPIIGVRELPNAKVKAASVIKSWHCKLSRLAKDVTVDGIKEYMSDFGVNLISVESLTVRRGQPATMHIEVPLADKDRVMSSDFWPSGVRIAGWRFLHVRKQFPRFNRNWAHDY